MKKLIFVSMIAIAAMGIIGCGADDGTKADVRWTNSIGGAQAGIYHEISWVGSSNTQTWNESLNTGDTSQFKGVEDLVGEGQCKDASNNDYTIWIQGDPDGGSYALTENASETLVMDQVAKK